MTNTLLHAKWLRDNYKINIEILLNHKRSGLRADWWDKDFYWTWEQYKIAQGIYVTLKRGVKVVDAITFEEGQG